MSSIPLRIGRNIKCKVSYIIDANSILLDPKTRARQLSSTTASPDKFLIANEWYTDDCVLAEQVIHERLKEYRINDKREFFKITFSVAMKTINEIVNAINNHVS